jgi:hypothetical protein
MMLTITIGRDSLDLEPLVITGSRDTTPSGIWVPESGIEQMPGLEPLRTYAPASAYVRRKLLAVVLNGNDLVATFRVQGTDADPLTSRRAELEQAVAQFVFPITLSIDGIGFTGEGEASWPAWSARTPDDRAANRDRCRLAIPVNP